MNNKTKYIAYTSLFTALVTVATFAHFPIPATQGFINLGDVIILTLALSFGGIPVLIAGGIGSALADIILGYAVWAPFTLIIKALEGYVAYLVYVKFFKCKVDVLYIENNRNQASIKGIIALSVGALVMVIGYYFASVVVLGTFESAFLSIPSNLIQGFAGALIAYILVYIIKINKFIKY